MSDSGNSTPFGPGFVAATVVLAAILTCGLILLLADDKTPPAAAPTVQAVNPVPKPVASSCSLPDAEPVVPTAPPPVDGWEVSRRVVVPRSSAFGPGVVDADGFRKCFAHSPTGAVFAAYNALSALADQTKVKTTVPKLFVPGPETEALLRESSSGTSDPTQLAGFRVLAANRDQVTVMLAVPVETQYVSLTLTMVWYGGDWRVQPPPAGAAVGAPFAQVRSLADFVKWSGL